MSISVDFWSIASATGPSYNIQITYLKGYIRPFFMIVFANYS